MIMILRVEDEGRASTAATWFCDEYRVVCIKGRCSRELQGKAEEEHLIERAKLTAESEDEGKHEPTSVDLQYSLLIKTSLGL
jgi:hypothetical protein